MTSHGAATTREELEQQRRALLGQLRRLGDLMRGTVAGGGGGGGGARGGGARGGCGGGEPHRKVYLSVNVRGRTQGAYLEHGRVAAVAPLLAEYQRAGRVAHEVAAGN